MRTTVTYTVKHIAPEEITTEIMAYIFRAGLDVTESRGEDWDIRHFDLLNFFRAGGHVLVCYRGDQIVGFVAATLKYSLLDPAVRILNQTFLFAEPGTRASFYLYHELIDFGKRHADHILTMIAADTNIKPETLERLGFEKLETLYRMKVTHGK